MLRIAVVLLVLAAPLHAAAQQRSQTLVQALAACRRNAPARPPGPPVAGYHPSALQLSGLDFARPANSAPVDVELARATELLGHMPASDPQRPDLLFRIGVLAMERAHEAGHGAEDYRGAVAALTSVVRDHPRYVRHEEATYRLALAQEALGDMAAARQTFLQVLRNYPTSPFVPYVYLGFGEFYFAEGDMAAASQFFEKVLDFPTAPPATLALARYRLAWASRNLGDHARARESFWKVLGLEHDTPGDLDVAATAVAVRREICL